MNTIDIRIWPSVSKYPRGGWEHSYVLPNGGQGGGGHRGVTLEQAKAFIASSLNQMGYGDYRLNFIVGDMTFTPRAEQESPASE